MVAFLTLLALLLAGSSTGVTALFQEMPMAAKIIVSLTNFTIVGQDQVFFMSVQDSDLAYTANFKITEVPLFQVLLVPQAWTLSLEIMFYILAPYLVHNKTRVIVAFCLSLLLKGALLYLGFGLQEPWDYRFFPTELTFFMLGVMSHQFVAPRMQQLRRRNSRSLLLTAVSIVSIVILAYPVIPIYDQIKSVLLFCILGVFLPLLFDFQRRYRFDDFLGHLSYPIYIWHILVMNTWRTLTEGAGLSQHADMVAILFCTVLVSWAGLHMVDAPIQKIRSKFRVSENKRPE